MKINRDQLKRVVRSMINESQYSPAVPSETELDRAALRKMILDEVKSLSGFGQQQTAEEERDPDADETEDDVPQEA